MSEQSVKLIVGCAGCDLNSIVQKVNIKPSTDRIKP